MMNNNKETKTTEFKPFRPKSADCEELARFMEKNNIGTTSEALSLLLQNQKVIDESENEESERNEFIDMFDRGIANSRKALLAIVDLSVSKEEQANELLASTKEGFSDEMSQIISENKTLKEEYETIKKEKETVDEENEKLKLELKEAKDIKSLVASLLPNNLKKSINDPLPGQLDFDGNEVGDKN